MHSRLVRFTAAVWCGLAGAVVASAMAAGTPPAATPASAAAPAADPQALARELAELRTLQARLQERAEDPAASPLVQEQRTLVARLVVLLAAQQRPTAAPVEDPLATPPPPLGAPPYPMAAIDALRDRLDALVAQQRSLDVSARGLESQVAGLVAARRRAEEGVRLRQDQLAQARDAATRERLQAELEVARLEARIAAVELARADAARADARERAAALAARIDPLRREVDRARPHQVIDDEALQRVGESARAVRRQLQAQRQRAEARLARVEDAAAGAAPDAAVVREVAALRGEVGAIGELDQIEAGREEVWRQRRLALAAIGDEAQREPMQAVVGRSIEQLAARAAATADRLVQVRDTLRSERLRVEALPADAPTLTAERRALEARQREVDALEAVQERLERLQRLLQRSLDDLGGAVAAEPAAWHERVLATLRQAAAAVWRYELFSVSETTRVDGRAVTVDYGVTVGKSIGVVVLFVAGGWLASRISRSLIGIAVRRTHLSPQLGRVIHRWVLTLLLTGVLIVVLKLARIPLTVFAFLGGALAIGVGFGTQNIIKNLISGVIILFERKVRVGDVVTIDGVSGTVSSVDLRATTVRGFDGIEAIVPNSQLLENRVSNWSYGSPTVRRAILVGLRYGDSAREASARMLACAQADPSVLRDPPPEVLFDDFGGDAQLLRLQYWTRLGGTRPGPTVDSDLRHAITDAFAAAGLTIAFPQRDVHLRLVEPAPAADPLPSRPAAAMPPSRSAVRAGGVDA